VAARFGIDADCGAVGNFEFLQNSPGVFQVALAGFGGAYVAGGAIEKPDTKPIFQRSHGPGDGGRRQVQPAGCRSKAGFFGNGNKHLKLMESIHIIPNIGIDYSEKGEFYIR
jgi:hypothetical protein